MASSPKFKVYRGGEYVAACKHAEDAAALVAVSGGEVRYGHGASSVVWREGEDGHAGDSYDGAAAKMQERIDARSVSHALGRSVDSRSFLFTVHRDDGFMIGGSDDFEGAITLLFRGGHQIRLAGTGEALFTDGLGSGVAEGREAIRARMMKSLDKIKAAAAARRAARTQVEG